MAQGTNNNIGTNIPRPVNNGKVPSRPANAPPQGTNIPRGNSNTGEITPANNGKSNGGNRKPNIFNNVNKVMYTEKANKMKAMIREISKLVAKRDLKTAAKRIKDLKTKMKKTINEFHADVREVLRQLKRNNVKNMKYGFLGFKTPKVMKMDSILYNLRKKVASLPPPPVKLRTPTPNILKNNRGYFRRAKNAVAATVQRGKNSMAAVAQRGSGFFGRMKQRYENARVERMLKNLRGVRSQLNNKNDNKNENLKNVITNMRGAALNNSQIKNRLRKMYPNVSNENMFNIIAKTPRNRHISNAARNAALKSLN